MLPLETNGFTTIFDAANIISWPTVNQTYESSNRAARHALLTVGSGLIRARASG